LAIAKPDSMIYLALMTPSLSVFALPMRYRIGAALRQMISYLGP